ncbi:hypothetical protein [Nocardioides albus]|uniref:Uncharacterized protein n=1 Tax=Nocardioides albus TaxID=1841 RepID=A0A7W5F9X7_9ACTN|nr:hypothetical protein [Nocardioides albus]MBB3090507.1 hypothetical protein [Nocardioides albus]GGU24405.1 hypothetical protein GCM10007979_23910 [Nocardioides albus]
MSETLTPNPAIRVVFGGLALFVWAGAVGVVRPLVTGEQGWTLTTMIGVPILVVMCIGTAFGVIASWTNTVRVDRDANEIHQRAGWVTHKISLAAPTTVRLTHTPVAFGSTVSPTWTVVVQRAGEVTMRINTPWVRNINDVLALLRPFLETNPDLPADDFTRRYLEHPEAELRPSSD